MITEKEYRAIGLFSSSDLRSFLEDKRKFYKEKVLLEPREEKYNRAMLIGNLVHTSLLEPHMFDFKYYMSICEEAPTGLMLSFVDNLFRLTQEHTDENGVLCASFEEISKEAYKESGFKITYDAVIKKFAGSNAEMYYKELRESKLKGLEVVCMQDLEIANKVVEKVKNDQFVGEIIELNNEFNELKIEGFDMNGITMKGMLDKMLNVC